MPRTKRPADATWSVTAAAAVTAGCRVTGFVTAVLGNTNADNRPAATNAAAVAGVTVPRAMPIWVAATMNGSDVAWRRPAATALRVPTSGRYTMAGSARTKSNAARKTGTRASVDGSSSSADRS